MLHHNQVIAEFILKNNIKVFAEVGVWKSIFTRSVLRATKGKLQQYWAIDQWVKLSKEHGHMHTRSQEDWDSLYIKACSYMPFFPELKVIRMESEIASKLFNPRYFPDGYFDMVYIDASHFYEDVKRDIELWLPKVKKGGFIGGHDYADGRFAGVKKAVNEKWNHVMTFEDSVWCRHV